MIFATAVATTIVVWQALWIAFVPWNYDICNSVLTTPSSTTLLWIAFVPWNYDICNSHHFIITIKTWLWIAFVPWNYDICNSTFNIDGKDFDVVNCFCSLKLWYLQQQDVPLKRQIHRCELLLFLEIMIFATAFKLDVAHWGWLWIAFVPWNYDICNSKCGGVRIMWVVVNCFCSLKLWYLQQLRL